MRLNLQHSPVLLLALLLAQPASAQQSALALPRNLAELTASAAVIVRGHVVSARMEKHPELSNLDTVVVTLRVRDTLKGQAGAMFTFRQYVWDLRARTNTLGYKKGQEVLLMLVAPSRYGLSSPAGVEQGRFRIERDATGREVAVNSHDNRRLFDGIGEMLAKEGMVLSPASANLAARHRRGPVAIDELSALIRQLAARSE